MAGELTGPAEIAVIDSSNLEVARVPLTALGSDAFELPASDRYHFQFLVPQGS